MAIKVIYATGIVQRFQDRAKAEKIVEQLRADGLDVTEDRDGDYFVDNEEWDRGSLKLPTT